MGFCKCCGQTLPEANHWADKPNKSGKTHRARTLENLEGVHPSLQAIVIGAMDRFKPELTGLPEFTWSVISGVRTLDEQKYLFKSGASKTLKSKHLIQSDGLGHAVDIGCFKGGIYLTDIIYYIAVKQAFFKEATQYPSIGLDWGGSWKGFVDPSHFQITLL